MRVSQYGKTLKSNFKRSAHEIFHIIMTLEIVRHKVCALRAQVNWSGKEFLFYAVESLRLSFCLDRFPDIITIENTDRLLHHLLLIDIFYRSWQ